MSEGSVRVPREVLDTIGILRESIVRNDAMRRHMPAYGSTSLGMNDVGLYGEHAVRYYLSQQTAGVTLTPPGDFTSGDVHVFRSYDGSDAYGVTHQLEVKTSRAWDWRRYGRSLNEWQLKRMTSVAIIWCVVPDELPADWVVIEGWLPVEVVHDTSATEPVIHHGQRHRRVHQPMRTPADLLAWLDALNVEPEPPF